MGEVTADDAGRVLCGCLSALGAAPGGGGWAVAVAYLREQLDAQRSLGWRAEEDRLRAWDAAVTAGIKGA